MAFIKDWQRLLTEELVENDRNITSLLKEIPSYEMLVENTEMRAPCDAVVHEIAPFQEKSAVQEAEMLISLIPLDVEFEAEVDIPAKDISWVKVGDSCRLKFDAFPFQQCGTLTGTITYISQDAFNRNPQQDIATDDGGELSAMARSSTYQARLRISGEFTGKAKDAELQAEIKVGNRTIINYILNPFVKAIDEAIREP